jgi:hypothetical protein
MEGCSAGAVAGLPDDPLVDILSRVPAKSICRFKCVSKAWRDLITHPDHRKKLRQAMQGLFYYTTEISEVDDSTMMSLGFIDLTARSVPLDIDPCFSFLRELPGIHIVVLLDSCNGLILFSNHQEQGSGDALGYVVCNPTTKQWGAVPIGGSPTQSQLTSTKLAFDPAVSSHFYLVQFAMDKEGNLMSLHAYSSETGIWSCNQTDEQEEQGELDWFRQFKLKLLSGPSMPDCALPSMPDCAFLNGFLHFMVSGRHLDQIVALDVQGKARRMIKVPVLRHRRRWLCYLGQSQGQLHYMAQKLRRRHGEGHRLDIWVLQDYGKEEWKLKDTVNLRVISDYRIDTSDFHVVCIHPDCNVVFFNHALRLIAYDMDRKKASVVTTLGDEDEFWYFAHYVPCFSESPSLLTNEH